jgi:hypothetical protein
MSRFTPGFKGPMTPAAGPRPRTPIATPATPASGTRTAPTAGVGMKPALGTRAGVGMKKGGDVKMDMAKDKKLVKKAVGMHEKQLHGGKKSNMTKLKAGGMTCGTKKMSKGGGIETKGKTKGRMC